MIRGLSNCCLRSLPVRKGGAARSRTCKPANTGQKVAQHLVLRGGLGYPALGPVGSPQPPLAHKRRGLQIPLGVGGPPPARASYPGSPVPLAPPSWPMVGRDWPKQPRYRGSMASADRREEKPGRTGDCAAHCDSVESTYKSTAPPRRANAYEGANHRRDDLPWLPKA
jgi:hypothetical protein